MTPTDAATALPVRRCRGVPVPDIAAWTDEITPPAPLILIPGLGLAYADEDHWDRDEHGVPWQRCTGRRTGNAEWNRVHPRRQRNAMGTLRCQVCRAPADHDERGYLWLLHDPGADAWPDWPENVGTTHPPVCRRCLPVAAGLCPHLLGNAVSVRVQDPVPYGVEGTVYAMRRGRLVAVAEEGIVPYRDPAIRMTLACQAVRALNGCTVTDEIEVSA